MMDLYDGGEYGSFKDVESTLTVHHDLCIAGVCGYTETGSACA